MQQNPDAVNKVMHHVQFLLHYRLYFPPEQPEHAREQKAGGNEAKMRHLDPKCSRLVMKHLVCAAQDVRRVLLGMSDYTIISSTI